MSVNLEIEKDNLAVFRVSGLLAGAEIDTVQRECENIAKKTGRVKILVLPECDFSGWERREDGPHNTFAGRSDQFIGKIAIVGKAEWRDLVYSFVGKGLRQVSVRYFKQDQESAARLWLDTP